MYWLGLRPGDVHLNICSPGWAKHAWSCFFAPWIAEATVFVYNYARFDAAALLAQLRERRGHARSARRRPCGGCSSRPTSRGGPGALREVVGAGEPLNPEVIEQVRAAWGLTIRDGYGQTETTAQSRNTPGPPVKPGSMGRPLPGCRSCWSTRSPARPGATRARSASTCRRHPLPPDDRLPGRPERNAEAMAGGYYHTGDVAPADADGYITYIGRTDDVFKARTTRSARSSWRAC